jgi:pyruvate carboxylase
MRAIKKILIANRSEIAIRISRAATELGYKTVSIYSYEDRFALHRFKTDESYLVGSGLGPIQAYLDYKGIVQIALNSGCDAIHPGYGFLSENPEFADECAKHNILFVGPSSKIMRSLGNKVEAKKTADKAKVPTIPSTGPLPRDIKKCKALAKKISATFHCSLSIVGYKINQVVTGTVVGSIISSKRGNDGFGYDPFFIPQNSNKTFAEMGLKEKMFLSHRFEAFKILSITQK